MGEAAWGASLSTTEQFDVEKSEYNNEVTPGNAQEIQIGGTRAYTFHKGGYLGRVWVPYSDSKVTFNIDSGETLRTSSNSSDGFEVSNNAQVTIVGGNFESKTSSGGEEDSAINIRSNASFTANVENFTAISGKEASLKIMAEYPGHVDAKILASNSLRLLTGGTGLAMQAFDNASVAADISAKNIEIVSSSDTGLPRRAGIYLMAYDEESQTLDLKMTATETMTVQGAKYGLAGWGDVDVNLQAKDISLSASRSSDSAGKGIYLDTYGKTPAAGRDVTISATNTLTVDGYYGLRIRGESSLGLSGKQVSISGVYAAGYLEEKAHSTITADCIRMQGEDYTALVYNAASLDLHADTVYFNADGSTTSYATYVAGDGANLSIQGKNGGYTKFLANGYMKANKSGNISINMGDGSVYSGYTSRENGGTLNLNLDGVVRWNVVRDSSLSSLNFGSNSTARIDLGADGGSMDTILTVDNLSGSGGTFHMDTDIEGDLTDQIIIGQGTGSHGVYVNPTGAEPSREAMDSFIVRQERGNATFSLANKNGKVEHGIYFYELASRHGTTVAARSASLLGTEDSGLTEWYLRRAPGDEKSPTGETVLGLSGMASAYAMYMGQLSDLRERLGEIRYGNGTDGLWVRGFTQENRLSGLAGIDFSQNFYGTSFGYDHLVEQNENNKWLFGMRGQLTKADQRIDGLHDGSGDSRSYGLAAYATWQHSDGWYADTVLSWDWYDQNLKTRMMDGTRVHASYNTFAGGISQEFGRLFRFDNGLFVEPQLQLSWYWMKGTDFTTSNGMDVDQDDMYALTGRAGLVLGKKWDFDEERYFQPYIKGGVNHEFAGDQKVLVNGIEFTDDLRGTRGYYGAGFDLQFTRNARLYAEFEREDGCKASTPWSVSAGLRVEF